MSADNWAQCPQCQDELELKVNELENSVDEAYGKLPPDEWVKFKDEVEKDIDALRDAAYTFREDYGFYGASEGSVEVSYRGSCKVCGLTFKREETWAFYPQVIQ